MPVPGPIPINQVPEGAAFQSQYEYLYNICKWLVQVHPLSVLVEVLDEEGGEVVMSSRELRTPIIRIWWNTEKGMRITMRKPEKVTVFHSDTTGEILEADIRHVYLFSYLEHLRDEASAILARDEEE